MSGIGNSQRYLEIPQKDEEPVDYDMTASVNYIDHGSAQQQGGFLKWLRSNYLKLAQMVLLLDIAILITIDVTATLAARVRRSKSCLHQSQGAMISLHSFPF